MVVPIDQSKGIMCFAHPSSANSELPRKFTRVRWWNFTTTIPMWMFDIWRVTGEPYHVFKKEKDTHRIITYNIIQLPN